MILSHSFENIGEEYKSAVLSNGLRVNVMERPGFSSSYAVFAVNYGGADMRFRLGDRDIETPAGIAHYLEHKMFDMPEGDNAMAQLSANGAEPNAYTSVAMTCYYFQSTEKFYDNLRTLLRFVTTPYFTDETVEKERGIIGQEIMMGLDNPDRTLYYNLLGMLYRNHPISQDIAGTVESISEITADTLYSCHRTFYCPGNMVLCVEGDVDAEKVVALAEEVLGEWKDSPVPLPEYGESDGVLPYEAYKSAKCQISEKQFLAGAKVIPTAGDFSRQQLAIKLALQVMFGNSSSFFNRLYSSGLINNSFVWDVDYTAGVATIIIGGESPDPDAVLAEINAELEKTEKQGLDPVIFERAKKASIGGSLRTFEDFDSVCTSLAEGCFNNMCIFDGPAILESLTREECGDIITEFMAPERLALSVIEPM